MDPRPRHEPFFSEFFDEVPGSQLCLRPIIGVLVVLDLLAKPADLSLCLLPLLLGLVEEFAIVYLLLSHYLRDA